MNHPLDAPYPDILLSMIRSHLHKHIVRKLVPFTKEEYLVVFDESNEVDVSTDTIKFQAGRPFSVCLCTSPLDGVKVEQLTRRAFNLPLSYLKQFVRYYALVKKSDAVALYGIEVSGTPSHLDMICEEKKRFSKIITHEIFTTVKVTDNDTGRSISVKKKNGNAFDIEMEAIRILRNG